MSSIIDFTDKSNNTFDRLSSGEKLNIGKQFQPQNSGKAVYSGKTYTYLATVEGQTYQLTEKQAKSCLKAIYQDEKIANQRLDRLKAKCVKENQPPSVESLPSPSLGPEAKKLEKKLFDFLRNLGVSSELISKMDENANRGDKNYISTLKLILDRTAPNPYVSDASLREYENLSHELFEMNWGAADTTKQQKFSEQLKKYDNHWNHMKKQEVKHRDDDSGYGYRTTNVPIKASFDNVESWFKEYFGLSSHETGQIWNRMETAAEKSEPPPITDITPIRMPEGKSKAAKEVKKPHYIKAENKYIALERLNKVLSDGDIGGKDSQLMLFASKFNQLEDINALRSIFDTIYSEIASRTEKTGYLSYESVTEIRDAAKKEFERMVLPRAVKLGYGTPQFPKIDFAKQCEDFTIRVVFQKNKEAEAAITKELQRLGASTEEMVRISDLLVLNFDRINGFRLQYLLPKFRDDKLKAEIINQLCAGEPDQPEETNEACKIILQKLLKK